MPFCRIPPNRRIPWYCAAVDYLERQRWTLVGVVVLVILTSGVDLLGPF